MNKLILMGLVAGCGSILLPGSLPAQTPVAALPVTEIAKIEAQEFARALAQLKVQEVALQRATPVDDRAIELNRAQQNALTQELAKIAAVPVNAELQRLEAEREDYAKDLMPKHPKMIALQAEIDQAKAALAAGR